MHITPSKRVGGTLACKYLLIATTSTVAIMLAFPITVFTVEGWTASRKSSTVGAWDGFGHGSEVALTWGPLVIATLWLSAPVFRFLLGPRHRTLRTVARAPLNLRSVGAFRYWGTLLVVTASCGAIVATGAYLNAAISYDGWSRNMQEIMFFGGAVFLPAYPAASSLVLHRIDSRRTLVVTSVALAALAAASAFSVCFALTPA